MASSQPTWKRILKRTLPFIGLAGDELTDLDANDEGADDQAGKWLGYTSEAGAAILAGNPIPLPPIGLLTEDQTAQLHAQTVAASKGTTAPLPAKE